MKVLGLALVIICVQIPVTFSKRLRQGNAESDADDNQRDRLAEDEGYETQLPEDIMVNFDDPKYKDVRDSEAAHLARERERGDLGDMLEHRHKYVPVKYEYDNLARRFIWQYPYQEKVAAQIDEEAEAKLNKAVKVAIQQISEDERLRPVKASPEVVLAVAKQSALLDRSKPVKQIDENYEKDILRAGDYWNAVWKEEVPDPTKTQLRSDKHIESVKVKIMPGSKLHKLVSITKELSPRYLYILNNKDNQH